MILTKEEHSLNVGFLRSKLLTLPLFFLSLFLKKKRKKVVSSVTDWCRKKNAKKTASLCSHYGPEPQAGGYRQRQTVWELKIGSNMIWVSHSLASRAPLPPLSESGTIMWLSCRWGVRLLHSVWLLRRQLSNKTRKDDSEWQWQTGGFDSWHFSDKEEAAIWRRDWTRC